MRSEEDEEEERKENAAVDAVSEPKPKYLSAKKREILVHVPSCQCSLFPVVSVLNHRKKKQKQLAAKKRKILVQVPSCQCSEL